MVWRIRRPARRPSYTFPKSNVYADLGELLKALGIGEAVVTILSENGAPTPVAWTRLRPPSSLMAQLALAQQQAMVAASPLQAEDGTTVDRDSAYEILLTEVAPAPEEAPEPAPRRRGRSPSGRTWPLRAVRSPPSSDPACSRASPARPPPPPDAKSPATCSARHHGVVRRAAAGNLARLLAPLADQRVELAQFFGSGVWLVLGSPCSTTQGALTKS